MAMGWQKGILFAGGVLLGVGLGAWAVVGPLHAVHGPVTARHADAAAAAEPVAALDAPAGPLRCDLSPIVPKAGSGDGQQSLQSHPGGASASEVSDELLAGKEAAASGRHRDAEIAFLNACRSAQVVPGHDGTQVADADYQLARLYAKLAVAGGPQAREFRDRAVQLYGATLNAYRTRYGVGGEKTRFAAEGLQRLESSFGSGGTTTQVAAAAPAQPAPQAAEQAAAATPKPRETLAAVPLAQHTEAASETHPAPAPDTRATRVAETHATPAPEKHAVAEAQSSARAREKQVAAKQQSTPRAVDTHAAGAGPDADHPAHAPADAESTATPPAAHTWSAPWPKPRETMAAVPLQQRTGSAAMPPHAAASAASHEHADSAAATAKTAAGTATGASASERDPGQVATRDRRHAHAASSDSDTQDEEVIIVRPARRPQMDNGPDAMGDDADAPPRRWRRHADPDDGEE